MTGLNHTGLASSDRREELSADEVGDFAMVAV